MFSSGFKEYFTLLGPNSASRMNFKPNFCIISTQVLQRRTREVNFRQKFSTLCPDNKNTFDKTLLECPNGVSGGTLLGFNSSSWMAAGLIFL